MKKYLLVSVLFLCSLFTTPLYAQEKQFEHISEFNSDITINQDATIDVIEEIHYYFPSPRHGILWEYPIAYNTLGFRRSTSFDLEEVYYYPEGNPEERKSVYEESRSSGWVELKIGEASRTITGNYVYVIKYTLQDVGISYFDTHDEVYFNVIGPGWQVPILEATATISTFTDYTDSVCYTGEENTTSQSCEFTPTEDMLILETTSRLEPYEALNFALKFSPGSMEDRSTQLWISRIISNLGILLPIPTAIFLISLLKKKWKNKEITVIPHYEVPEDLDPLIAGYVYKSKHDFKHISSAIIWMATRGYLSLEREKRNTYLNKEVKEIEGEESYIEELFSSLFIKGPSVKINSMPSSFIYKLQSIFSDVMSHAKSEDYIDSSRITAKSLLTMFGFLVGGFTLFVLVPTFAAFAAVGTAIGIGLSALVAIIVASKIDIRGKEGNELYYELEGLKMYIDTAEKHRIEFHNNPEKFRGVFETLLPFAMIFGLEKKWAKEFKDLYENTQPDWYRGDFSTFDALVISSAVNSLNRSVKSATKKAYGSSSGVRSSGWSSGGSGFSGGSSGGGGGGSGGGSW